LQEPSVEDAVPISADRRAQLEKRIEAALARRRARELAAGIAMMRMSFSKPFASSYS
jgi:hypothetical protein